MSLGMAAKNRPWCYGILIHWKWYSMQLSIKWMATQCCGIKNHFFIKFLILLFLFFKFYIFIVTCNLNKKLYMIAIFMCYIPLRTPCNCSSNPIYYIEFTIASIFFFVLWFYHFFKFLIINMSFGMAVKNHP